MTLPRLVSPCTVTTQHYTYTYTQTQALNSKLIMWFAVDDDNSLQSQRMTLPRAVSPCWGISQQCHTPLHLLTHTQSLKSIFASPQILTISTLL